MSSTFDPPLPFARPKLPDFSLMMDRFKKSWDEASLTKGPISKEYEDAVCRHLAVPHAVATSSCTTGLMLVFSALKLEGECLVPSFTFSATVSAILWNHLTPVFVECHPRKFTVDLQSLSAACTPRTSSLLVPYIFGNPPPIEELEAFCKRRHLTLVLDAAHAFGTLYRGKPAGSHGTAEVFSTSATKLLSTGEGGMVATRDSEFASALRSLREYGHAGDYVTRGLGLNGRLTEFQSLMGLLLLPSLEAHAQRRNHLAELYRQALKGLPVTFQELEPESRSSIKDFALLLDGPWADRRDEVARLLLEMGIPTRNYFSPPAHRHPYFAANGKGAVSLPVTESVSARILCLPIYDDLSEDAIIKIGEVMNQIFETVTNKVKR